MQGGGGLSMWKTQQPTIYVNGEQQLAMRARGQQLVVGGESELQLLTIELTIPP
jgi:hypothetical protein